MSGKLIVLAFGVGCLSLVAAKAYIDKKFKDEVKSKDFGHCTCRKHCHGDAECYGCTPDDVTSDEYYGCTSSDEDGTVDATDLSSCGVCDNDSEPCESCGSYGAWSDEDDDCKPNIPDDDYYKPNISTEVMSSVFDDEDDDEIDF